MSLERRALVGLVLSVLLSVPASTAISQEAEEPQQKQKNPFKETPCASDSMGICGTARGWRLTYQCLRNHYTEVAPECAAHTDEILAKKRARVAARHEAWKKACSEEIEANCSQYTKLQAMKGCLDRIRDQVNDECDAALPIRGRYQGPGMARWRDGSEPENFIEEREKARRERYEARQRQFDARARLDAEAEAKAREERKKRRQEAANAETDADSDAAAEMDSEAGTDPSGME